MEYFGRYELIRRIAVGGMAEVFLARTSSLDGFEKIVIIKRIRPELNDQPEFFSMFIDESRISSALSHPNIVLVFDYGKIEASYYIAMDYISGSDVDVILGLRDVFNQGLDPGLALHIMHEVCAGLDHAHNLKSPKGEPLDVVHRDVSPANILVGFDGSVKITDFGIAHARDFATEQDDGRLYGKVPYMSPEQARGEPTDRRTDIFSAALVLWELLVGRPAYGDEPEMEMEIVRKGKVPKLSKAMPQLPKALSTLLAPALAPKAKDRYSTAGEFAEAIAAYLREHHPGGVTHELDRFLKTHNAEIKEARGALAVEASRTEQITRTLRQATGPVVKPDPDFSPEINKAVAEFHKRPSLWLFVDMGRIAHREGNTDDALVFFYAAAARFAQAGLMAQSLLCCKEMLKLQPFDSVSKDFRMLPQLLGASDADVTARITTRPGKAQRLVRRLLPDAKQQRPPQNATPLLSYLMPNAFAEFARSAEVRTFEEGESIVTEGQQGHTMFLIAEGRVLVEATAPNGQRLYLSSMMAGDFFGENSFFTGAVRSATVRAVRVAQVFEIDRALYDRSMANASEANDTLLRFYKERIVSTLLAKSKTLGLLPSQDRAVLAEESTVRIYEPGEVVIKEGARSREFYLIKGGSAEVFAEFGGPRTIYTEIGPGTIFGEVAALRDVPRTASVAAKSRLEVLRLSGDTLAKLVSARPDVLTKIFEIEAERTRSNMDGSPLAGSLQR